MTDKPESKDAKKATKEPRPIIHGDDRGRHRKAKPRKTREILHGAKRQMRVKRLSKPTPKEETLTFDDGAGAGSAGKRIKEDEVEAAFKPPAPRKKP